MTVKIVSDSSLTIEPELARELGITIVPISLTIDGIIYQDSDLTLEEYMEKMRASKTLPKTSQPPVGVFAEVFEKLAADGSQILGIFIADSLSGTIEAARQGGIIAGADVVCVDSEFTDQAMKFQVVEAARMALAGASREAILEDLIGVREATELYIGISTLENLVKGGRISRARGLIGSVLNFKVILEMKNKTLHTLSKGRGMKTFQKWLDEFVFKLASSGRKVKEIGISHVENLEFANTMKTALQACVEKPIAVLNTSSVIATHTGPGAWAVLVNYEKATQK